MEPVLKTNNGIVLYYSSKQDSYVVIKESYKEEIYKALLDDMVSDYLPDQVHARVLYKSLRNKEFKTLEEIS